MVWLAASVERIASPSEPPTCWAVLNSPEASPASSLETPPVPSSVIGTNVRPMPEAHRHQPDEQVADVAAVDRQLGEDEHPGRGQA